VILPRSYDELVREHPAAVVQAVAALRHSRSRFRHLPVTSPLAASWGVGYCVEVGGKLPERSAARIRAWVYVQPLGSSMRYASQHIVPTPEHVARAWWGPDWKEPE
jgi:hypothetical protein